MGDIQTVFTPASETFDWAISNGDLLTGDDLYNAIKLSLFTDARAKPVDVIPDGSGNPRGCPIDIGGGYQLGSRLWLLRRQPATQQNLVTARDYCLEALAWITGDSVASSLNVITQYTQPNMLGIEVTLTMPDGTTRTYNYSWAWAEIS